MGSAATRRRGAWLPPLAILLGATASASATRAWWLVPLGAAVGASLYFRNPRQALVLPSGLNPEHRAQATELLLTHRALQTELAQVPLALRELCRVTDARLCAVTGQALGFVARHQQLETRAGALTRERSEVGRRSLNREALDPRAREALDRARARREAQKAHQLELRRACLRLEAELSAAQAALDESLAALVVAAQLSLEEQARRRPDVLLALGAALDATEHHLALTLSIHHRGG